MILCNADYTPVAHHTCLPFTPGLQDSHLPPATFWVTAVHHGFWLHTTDSGFHGPTTFWITTTVTRSGFTVLQFTLPQFVLILDLRLQFTSAYLPHGCTAAWFCHTACLVVHLPGFCRSAVLRFTLLYLPPPATCSGFYALPPPGCTTCLQFCTPRRFCVLRSGLRFTTWILPGSTCLHLPGSFWLPPGFTARRATAHACGSADTPAATCRFCGSMHVTGSAAATCHAPGLRFTARHLPAFSLAAHHCLPALLPACAY